MPFGLSALNPWVFLVVFVAFVGVGAGGYFKGHSDGVNSVKADLADSYAKALDKFTGDVTKAAAQATADALKDFGERTKVLDELAAKFQTAQGVMNAASVKLAQSLRGGACILSPVQRQLLECMRRPSTAGCSAGGAPSG